MRSRSGRSRLDRIRVFSFRLNRNGALSFCFDAFSSREPVSTSLENALSSRIDLAGSSGRIGEIMEAKFQIFLILLAVLAGTALLAKRINTAPAILLLLAGTALAFVPGMPSLELPPELVLLLVLPPLIYSASVAMSWREFRFNLRRIILLS